MGILFWTFKWLQQNLWKASCYVETDSSNIFSFKDILESFVSIEIGICLVTDDKDLRGQSLEVMEKCHSVTNKHI